MTKDHAFAAKGSMHKKFIVRSYKHSIPFQNFGPQSILFVLKTLTIFFYFLFSGPCGGKTTGQARLCTFFENLGWKVRKI